MARQTVERAKNWMADWALRKAGLVEVDPELSERERGQVNWTSYCCELVLQKGGTEVQYVFDPDKAIQPVEPGLRLIHFKSAISSYLNTGNDEHLRRLFPNIEPRLLTSVIKRITSDKGILGKLGGLPETDKVMAGLLNGSNGSDDGLRWVYSILDHQLNTRGEDGQEPGIPTMHIIAHQASPKSDRLVEHTRLDRFSKLPGGKRILGVARSMTKTFLQATAIPYLGASVLAAELEENGCRKIQHWTFSDAINGRVEARDGDIVWVTGALMSDVPHLRELKIPGRVIIGGLAATIDPQAVINNTNADVFIGELEGAVPAILGLYRKAESDQRFVLRRGGTDLTEDQGGGYQIRQGDEGGNLYQVDLKLPVWVDRNEYYSPERETGGQLSRRVEHEVRVRSPILLRGRIWEVPSVLGETHISCGCTEGCNFCSTVMAIGREPRRIPPESLARQLQAMLQPHVLEVSQNFLAVGRDNEHAVEEYLSIFQTMGKKMLMQADLSTLAEVALREPDLLRQTVSGALCGLEHPGRIKGTAKKQSDKYAEWLKVVRSAGLLVIGTAITGLDGHSPKEMAEWLTSLGIHAVGVFPRVRIPGSPGVPRTAVGDREMLAYRLENVCSKADTEAANLVNKAFYSPREIVKRMIKMRGYSLRRRVGALAFNLGMGAIYGAGLDIEDSFRAVWTE